MQACVHVYVCIYTCVYACMQAYAAALLAMHLGIVDTNRHSPANMASLNALAARSLLFLCSLSASLRSSSILKFSFCHASSSSLAICTKSAACSWLSVACFLFTCALSRASMYSLCVCMCVCMYVCMYHADQKRHHQNSLHHHVHNCTGRAYVRTRTTRMHACMYEMQVLYGTVRLACMKCRYYTVLYALHV
jgi:hypothetical protein